jgi:hypothetical protein
LIKKSNVNGWNWKITKSKSIQLKYWGLLCSFAKSAHLLRWRREKTEGEEKLSLKLRAPCLYDWHVPTTFSFFIYKKNITFLTSHNNYINKKKVNKPKISLYIRQKKKNDPKSYRVITLYKKYKNVKNLTRY